MSNSNYLETKLEEEIAKVISKETQSLLKQGYFLTKTLNDQKNDAFRLMFFDDFNPKHEVLFVMVRKYYDFYSDDFDWGFRDNFSPCHIYLGSISRANMDSSDIYSFASFIDNSKKELVKQFFTRKEYCFKLDIEMDEKTTVLSMKDLLELHIDYLKGRIKRVPTPPMKPLRGI